MCEEKLTPEIISLLENAVEENLENFNVVVHDGSAASLGYLGDILLVSLTNEASKEQHHFFIKQAIEANDLLDKVVMENTYFNEVYFYKNVWKTFDNFQKKFSRMKPFDKIPKFYGSNGNISKQKFVLEDLTYSGYRVIPRPEAFDEDKLRYILTEFGRFHGISAAFREHHPGEYKTLMSRVKDSTGDLFKTSGVKLYFSVAMNELLSVVENDEIKQKLKKFATNPSQVAHEALKYDGRNPVFSHGDCWSNNIMVKYDEHDQLSDIRLIDFQLCRIGSVVSDLSYLIYSGFSKRILDNLDYFLKVYHDSFSETLLAFDLEPSRIFTYDDLLIEWKDYCSFGFTIALASWYTKLSTSYEKKNLLEINENIRTENIGITSEKPTSEEDGLDRKTLHERYKDLVQHLFTRGYI